MGHIELLRVREKAYFAEADDPDRLLGELFGAVARRPASNADAASEAHASLPLILISQLPRSGGTLLSQLLDGHPQILAYPYEMRIGYPGKCTWPSLKPHEPPGRLFAKLFQPELVRFAVQGYRKPGKGRQGHALLSFDYAPQNHFREFVRLIKGRKTEETFIRQYLKRLSWLYRQSGRDVLDCYFNAFFDSWPEGKSPNPRYVAGFVPSMATSPASIARFFADYPEGRLVTIMRDPLDWFVSRRAHTDKGMVRYGNLELEMAKWNKMARAALTYRCRYKDSVLLLSFSDLVADREGTMRRFANWCGIDSDAALFRQTFSGRPIAPNTNFDDALDRLPSVVLKRSSQLDEAERMRALELTKPWRSELEAAGCLV